MRALSLLGAGAQPWSTSVCSARQDRLAYASTVAIYVYQREGPAREWGLRCILTEQHTAVKCLAWHPVRAQLLASATSDLRVSVWCAQQQRVVASLAAPSEPTLLDWNPFESDTVSFVYAEGRALLTWTAHEGNTHTGAYRDHVPFSSPATCLHWHTTQPGRLAFGHQDGSLSFYAAEGRVQLHVRLSGAEEGEVRAVQWDPLSEDYLLVAHAGGSLRLVAAQGPTTLASFRLPAACRARCLAWLPDCPGMFVSGDDESGVLRVWTVGRETPLENRTLQASGVRALVVVPPPAQNALDLPPTHSHLPPPAQASLACVFSDGGLGVYDLRRATWELNKEAGHTETVFTCAFRPDDSDVLATGSFDGTIKFWSCSSGELVLKSSTPGRESIVYSVSWAPAPLSLLAAATARDGVLLVDSARARVTQRLTGHGTGVTVYCVAWCQADARRLASGGADGTCLITQHRGELEVQRCKHPGPVFGCDWQGRDLLATGCEDGHVRVFKVTCSNQEEPVVLKGHTAKVFGVRWNPAQAGLLCSGSDDGSVRVWELGARTCVRRLAGHDGPVRGLVWCPALPHLLVSGAWDFAVRVWDVRSGACLISQHDHGADVYGLSVHPLRPLLLASCSRDSTVRLWTLASLVAKLGMSALLTASSLDLLLTDDFKLSEDWDVRLCGPIASHLRTTLANEQLDATQKFLAIMDTLSGDPSVRNLWDLIAVLRGTTEMSQLSRHYTRGIVHSSHVATCHLAEGTRLEIRSGPRAEARLREAAHCFLRAGALRRYCELMARLGEWDKALSVAPGVSSKYWRHLNQRRVTELFSAESELVLPHALAQGDVAGVVKLFTTRGQLDEAFTLSALSGEAGEASVDDDEPTQLRSAAAPSLMAGTARMLAERLLRSGAAVRAACTLLAVDHVEGALQTLVRGHELELAVALGRSLDREDDCHVHRALALLALRARRLGEWRLATHLIAQITNEGVRRDELLRLLVYFRGDEAERLNLHHLAGLPVPCECTTRAREEPEGSCQAVRFHLAAGETKEALRLGLNLLPELVLPGGLRWDPEEALRLVTLLQEVRIGNAQLTFLSSYVGCLLAVRRRYTSILQPLLEHAKEALRGLGGECCGLREEQLQALHEDAALKARLLEGPEPDPDRGEVHVSGCQMPAHSALRRCLLTSEPIRGPSVALDQAGEKCMALGDAIMWAKVGAMSPLGEPLNPF